MSKFFAALFAVCLLASHSVSAVNYGWYIQGYEDDICTTKTSDFYELSADISQSGAGSYSLLGTATGATGLLEVESYVDDQETNPLPTITLPDVFADATKTGCFQLNNVESSVAAFDVYAQLIVDNSASPATATLNLYSDDQCTTKLQTSGNADNVAANMEVGTGATPTECKDASEDVAKGSNGAGSTAIKSFGVVSSTTAGVTTYTLTAFSDAVGASDACATGGTKSTVTSVINACQFVGYSVDANGAFAVYAVLSDINTANSAKIVGAVFYNEETCTTPIDATPVPVDFTITTVQALSSNVLYGQLASTTAPFVFYTTSDSAGTTPFTVSYQTNLCQDVSSLSLTTKSVQFYLNFETGDVYAVGFTKVTCTDDDTNEAGASYPINLQLDTETTLTCQQVASDLYAKNQQDSSDDTLFVFDLYEEADCSDTSTVSLDVFQPTCTLTGFGEGQGPTYAKLAFGYQPTSNSGLLRFGLFALLASVIALIF